MREIRIIYAEELVTPSTRPKNQRLAEMYFRRHYGRYYTPRPSPADIDKEESELVMKLFDSI